MAEDLPNLVLENLRQHRADFARETSFVRAELGFIRATIDQLDSINRLQTIVHSEVADLSVRIDAIEARSNHLAAEVGRLSALVERHERDIRSFDDLSSLNDNSSNGPRQ